MFGKKRRNKGVIHTLVGEGTRIEGDLRFQGGCHIDGVVHGSVVADRDPEAFLSISADGRVEGSVSVPRVALNGKVEGDVHASELVQLGATARVVGNVNYELIEMTAGAEINGQLIHTTNKSKVAAKAPPASDKDLEAIAPGAPAESQA